MAQGQLPGLAADRELLMNSDNDRHVTKAKPTTSSLSRRSVLLAGATLAASAPMEVAQAQQPPSTQSKPNILFMLVDNLGYGELGVYGGGATRGAPTPRIDRLASEGFAPHQHEHGGAVHAQPLEHPDRTLRDPLRDPLGAVRRRGGRTHAMGGDDGRGAVGGGLCRGALRQMAPRQRGRPPAQRPGFRRV